MIDELDDIEDDDFQEWDCTKCHGSGEEENLNPIEDGPDEWIPCRACRGTGMRRHQTIF